MNKEVNFKKYFTILDILICVLLGFIYSFYPEYYTKGFCKVTHLLIGKVVIETIIFLLVTISIRYIIDKANEKKRKNENSFFELFNKNNKFYKHRLWIIAIIILLMWTPMIIALYPGTLSNDTWGQLGQFWGMFHGEILNDHHPVIDTLLMGTLIFGFYKILGNWHFAFFIYVCIQALITALIFSTSIIYGKEKLKLKNLYIGIMIALYALIPIFPGSVQAINKDSLFSWIYVLFFILYLEYIRTNGRSLDKTTDFIKLLIIALLCCLTKKVGFYVLLMSLLGLCLFKFTNRKKIFAISVSLVLVMMIIMPFIFEKLKIKPGGEQEKYSLLFQQTARYLKYNGNDVNKDERKIIETVIGKDSEEIVNVYNPIFADPVKGYEQVTSSDNYKKYLIVWVKQGLRHPLTYIDATNCMLSGWFSFRIYKPLMNMEYKNAKLASFVQDAYNWIYKIPIIKYLLTPGMYVSLIPLFSFSTIMNDKKNRKKAIALLPLFFSLVFGCFLAPDSGNVEGQRYLYPVTYTSILVLMWVLSLQNQRKKYADKK